MFDLEELEVELREKLTLLEQACNVVAWFRMVEREGRINLKALPMITEYFDQGRNKPNQSANSLELKR